MKCYRYYLLERPPMPGAFPKEKNNSPMEIVAFPARQSVFTIGQSAWGYASYKKPLTEKEIEDYELAAEF